MKWFLALNRDSPGFPLYAELVRVAIHTARKHTSLVPHLIFDGKDSELENWLAANGVTVIPRRSFLFDQLREIAQRTGNQNCLNIGSGAFLRLELPVLAAEHGWNDEFVLYTDCDIMFVGDPLPLLRSVRPRFFAVAPERAGDRLNMNSGVMLMNLANLRTQDAAFRLFVQRHLELFTRSTWDQEAYRTFYSTRLWPSLPWDCRLTRYTHWLRRKRWDDLPLELNWRPYWGRNPHATIIHFHGPKPQQEPLLAGKPVVAELKPIMHLATDDYFDLCREWRTALNAA